MQPRNKIKEQPYPDQDDVKKGNPSLTKKLIVTELAVIFFYIVFIFNIEFGSFYIIFFPALLLFFVIAFSIVAFIYEKKADLAKAMLVLNIAVILLILLLSVQHSSNRINRNTDKSNLLYFNIIYNGNGEARGTIQKQGNISHRFYATKSRTRFPGEITHSKSYLLQKIIPEYIDLSWHVTRNDIVPDERHYSLRIPVKSRLSNNIQELFLTRHKETGHQYLLHYYIEILNDTVKVSWKFKGIRNSINPFHYLWHGWLNLLPFPSSIPPVEDVSEQGQLHSMHAKITGEAPSFSKIERNKIEQQDKLTKGFTWRLKNKDELESKDLKWMKEFLNKGANVEGLTAYQLALNEIPDFTPIMLAAGSGKPEHIKLLIKQGANINATNFDGDTALTYAVFADRVDNVKTLLHHGADPTIKNHEKLTALHYAKQHDLTDIIKVLETKHKSP